MQSLCLNVEVLSADGTAHEVQEGDEEVFRAAEELGIDLSRRPHEGVGSIEEVRSEEHTSELQSRGHLVCRLLLEKKNAEGEVPRRQMADTDAPHARPRMSGTRRRISGD